MMGFKLKFVVPVAIFAVFLLVVGGFAVLSSPIIEFNVSDDSLIVSIVDGSGIGDLGNFSTRTSITNNAIYDINLTIDTNLSASTFFNITTDGIIYNNTIVIGANTNKTVYFKFNSSYPIGSYLINANISNTTNATENVTLPITLTIPSGLNVTVLNVTNVIGNGNVELPGNNITVNVSVSFWNGTIATGLFASDFNASMTHQYDSALVQGVKTLSIINFTEPVVGSGNYIFNITIPSTVLGGNYTIAVNSTNGTHSGIGTYSYFGVDESALKFTLGTGCESDLLTSATRTCTYTITNYGYRNASGINVTYTPTGCTVIPIWAYFSLSSLASTITNTTVTAPSSAGTCVVQTVFNNNGLGRWNLNTSSFSIPVKLPVVSVGVEVATTLVTEKVSKMAVVAPTTLEIEQGSSKSIIITIQNTGGYNIKGISLTASGITWFTSSDKKDVSVIDKQKDFSATINVPKDAEPKTYDVIITATGIDVNSKTVTSLKSFTLKVTPDSETQDEIKANLTTYRSEYDNVLGIYNSSIASGKNVSNITDTINQLTGLFTQADSFVGEGKYTEAYETLLQIKTLLTQAQDQLALESGMALQINPEVIAGGIVVVGLLGVIVYFARNKSAIPKMPKMKFKLPTKKTSVKSNTYKKPFKPSNDTFANKLKDKFKK